MFLTNAKKRACKYLLEYHLGMFMKDKITLDQLSVDMYNGKGEVNDVVLDVTSINELLESSNVGLEMVDGFVGSIEVSVPYHALLIQNSSIHFRDLQITLKPKQRDETTGVMFDSMFASFNTMESSLYIAQKCLNEEDTNQEGSGPQVFEGLEMFAQTINSVMSKVKLTFSDTIVRLEHLPKEANSGAGLEVRIKRVDCFDDLVDEPAAGRSSPSGHVFQGVAFKNLNLHIMGVELLCDEFSAESRTMGRHSPSDSPPHSLNLHSGLSPQMSPVYESLVVNDQPFKQPQDDYAQDPDPIKIAVLLGTQKVKISLKQQEELPGPKVELDMQLGVVNLHLSPRQVHLLMELAEGLSTPDLCDGSSKRRKRYTKSQPMDSDDFKRIETELQRQLNETRVKHQQQLHGGTFEDELTSLNSHIPDDDEEMFHSLSGTRSMAPSMDDSYHSQATVKSSATSGSLNPFTMYRKRSDDEVSSRRTASHPKHKSKDSTQKMMDEPNPDLSRFKVKVSFVSCMILHEDPPTTPSNGIDPVVTSHEKLLDMSEKYFGRVLGVDIAGSGYDMPVVRAQFSQACPFDHISILAKTLSVDVSLKSCSQMYTTSGEITLGVAEVVEALYGRTSVTHEVLSLQFSPDDVPPEYCELLVFEHDASPPPDDAMFSSTYAPHSPDVRIKINSYDKKHQSTRGSTSKADFHIELAKCLSEVDITIVDRISSLIQRHPFVGTKGANGSSATIGKSSMDTSYHQSCGQSLFTQTIDESNHVSRKTEVKVSSCMCVVTLRFPRVDFTPVHGTKPWWKRSLHNELLILELRDFEFKTSLWPAQTVQQFEFTGRDLHGLFHESADQEPVSFIRISTADNPLNEKDEGFDWPRFVLKFFPETGSVFSDVIDEVEDSSSDSITYDMCSGFKKTHSTPFSQTAALYNNEEMVLPGDRQEMLDYEDKAQSSTRISLEFNIPCVNAYLPSKHFIELIYNRVLNDFGLWEPLAPKPIDHQSMASMCIQPLQDFSIHTHHLPSFQPLKSNIPEDSDSELEESMPYLSVNEQRRRQRKRQAQKPSNRQQSRMCLAINIGKGKLTALAPLEVDDAEGVEKAAGADGVNDETGAAGAAGAAGGGDEASSSSSAYCGMFVVLLDDATIFTELEHNADPELMYTCVHSNSAQIYHQGCVPVPSKHIVIERSNHQAPPELDKTIYLSERGTYTKMSSGQVGCGSDSNDILSVAVKVNFDTAKNIKECQVALGVRATTLLHRVTPAGQNWLMQLIDLFQLLDYDIPGYTPPKVITELHAHIWSSSIDYRPLYLPYRSLLNFESFTVSSNVLAESATSLLRFIVEDASLNISDKTDVNYVDLKKNYVNIADMGMFELALRTSDGTDPKHPPKLDLRVSNNLLHVRTCADSMRALAEMIIYLASNTDLKDPSDKPATATTMPKPTSFKRSNTASSTLSSSPQMTSSCLESVHDMMADAMRESSSDSEKDESSRGNAGIMGNNEIFFNIDPHTSTTDSSPVVTPRHAPAADYTSDESYDTDEDAAALGFGAHARSTKSRSAPIKATRRSDPAMRDSASGGGMTMRFSARGGDDEEESVSMSRLSNSYDADDAGGADGGEWRASDEEFCIIDSPGLGIGPRDGKPIIKMLTKEPIRVIDDYLTIPLGRTDVLKAPDHFPPPVYCYTVRDVSVVWHMYGGKDFDSSPTSKTSNKTQRALANQRSARAAQLTKLSWQALGGAGRDIDVLLEVQLQKIRMEHDIYPENTLQASRQILLINDIEIRDRLASSKINKLLYQYSSDAMPKLSHTSMLQIKALHERPDLNLSRQECSVKVSMQPPRLNLDQGTMYFVCVYFMELCESAGNTSGDSALGTQSRDPVTAPLYDTEPIMQVTNFGDDALRRSAMQDEVIMSEETLLEGLAGTSPAVSEPGVEASAEPPIFFKCFIFTPDVPIRLDYHGKNVDMGQGTLANLIIGLAQLNCSELRLKRLHCKKGLLGVDKLAAYCREEWTSDIVKNQIPGILGGVGPMNSIVQIVRGVRDFFVMPVEQYRRDGRIVRGIQRGTQSFMTSTAMSTLELTSRLVQGVQYVAEIGYDMVTPTRTHPVPPRYHLRNPADFREGVVNAYTVITEGMKGTATDFVKSAYEGHEYKGLPGAVGGVLKQVPGAILQPVILATGATSNILDGVKNQMQPDKRRETEEKWKPEDV